jgi:hypothetical protein
VYPRYGTGAGLLQPGAHESVNKMAYDQGVKAQFSERRTTMAAAGGNEPRPALIDKPWSVGAF